MASTPPHDQPPRLPAQVLALESSSNGPTTTELMLQPVGDVAVALGCLLLLLTMVEFKDSCARLLYLKR